jgi:hypothetical protein
MWQHIELREVYRKAGWKESHFLISSRTLLSRTSSSSNSQSANNTLTRPMSTVGGTRYEDRTLPRGGGRDLNMSQLHGRVRCFTNLMLIVFFSQHFYSFVFSSNNI